MRSSMVTLLIYIGILFLIDLYMVRAVNILAADIPVPHIRKAALIVHLLLFVLLAGGAIAAFVNASALSNHENYKYFYYLIGFSILFYLPKLIFIVFMLADDLWWLIRKAIEVFSSSSADGGREISRLTFLYRFGAVVAAVPFAAAAYGMLKGRWDFRVIEEEVVSNNIPPAFDGYRVVQISDAHLGSFFGNFKPVEKALELVNSLEPDIIVFTGDLVNNYSEEAEQWIPYFQKLKARDGKFSVLGNHDYGSYGKWKSETEKKRNFNRLQEIHAEMGFSLLNNKNAILDKSGEKIAVLGVENWGVKPFPQKGDIKRAKAGAESVPFKLLLSHDPSHWDAEILKDHPDIELTLSGHTHGAQFGVELGNVKWSPVKYKYSRWAGLYTEGKQKLYVNRGFGYIGFPGRVGMPPEITVFHLKSA